MKQIKSQITNSTNNTLTTEEYEELIKVYNQTIELYPAYGDTYYTKALALSKLKKYTEAIESYDQAISLNIPFLDLAYYNKGFCFHELKKYQLAIESYDQAIKLNPNYENAYYNKALALSELKKYEEAVNMYDQAILLDDTSSLEKIYYNRGICLRKLKKYQLAIESYDQAIKIAPGYIKAYKSKLLALKSLDKEDSIETEKCLAIIKILEQKELDKIVSSELTKEAEDLNNVSNSPDAPLDKLEELMGLTSDNSDLV